MMKTGSRVQGLNLSLMLCGPGWKTQIRNACYRRVGNLKGKRHISRSGWDGRRRWILGVDGFVY